ncbi:hypothetical protein NM688_g728 [Phlebia brevispora]|uniref:Uncharacterized protein n=1 Tax=Phlebia brevispora TaxID=194682 RepID=A0ACC1TDI7_9APHY|nr:hypothetical protein NM688_g728 [Phlebia brevispora]
MAISLSSLRVVMSLAIDTISSKNAVQKKKTIRRRKNKAEDPIFRPRDDDYTEHDLTYIASLSPLTRIPRYLIPFGENLNPPTMHCGWLIDETVKQSLLEEAEKKNIAYYMYGLNNPDLWESLRRNNPGVQDPDLGEPDLYVDGTLELLAEVIMREMGINPWTSDHINYVLVPNKFSAPAFTVYTNHEAHNPPSGEVIESLRVRFGFTGKPRCTVAITVFPQLLHLSTFCVFPAVSAFARIGMPTCSTGNNNTMEPHAHDKISDPIFKRRRYRYTLEELYYISSISPLESLPHSLVPTPESRHPPQMHYALVLTDAVRERLLCLAEERQCIVYMCKFSDGDEDDEDDEDDYDALEPLSDKVNELATLSLLATTIVADLDVNLSGLDGELVNFIMTPSDIYTYGFTFYTNYELNRPPSNADIEKVRTYLGLTQEPLWYPNTLNFDWVEY